MRAQPPTAPDRPPPAAAGRSRDVSGEPGSSFAELLALDPAWTASAGGHGTRPEQAPATKAGARDGERTRERDQRPAAPVKAERRDEPTTCVPGAREMPAPAAGQADGQPSAAPVAPVAAVAAAVDAALTPSVAAPVAIFATPMQAFAAAATTPAPAATPAPIAAQGVPASTVPAEPAAAATTAAPAAVSASPTGGPASTLPTVASLAAAISAPAEPGEPVIAPLGIAQASRTQPDGLTTPAPATNTAAAAPQPPTTGPDAGAAFAGSGGQRATPERGDVPAGTATPVAPAAVATSTPEASAADVPGPTEPATTGETPAPAHTTASAPAAQPAATPAAAPQTPTAAGLASAPATPIAASVPAASTQGVVLSQAAEAVEHVLRLSQEHGIRHARISLRPVELGGVEIQLRSTAAGLSARIVADAPQAAQLLRAAGNDLVATLERQGVTLVELEIAHAPTTAADPRSGEAGARTDTGDQPRGRDERPAGAAHPTDTDTPVTTVLELPDGVLVDVLA